MDFAGLEEREASFSSRCGIQVKKLHSLQGLDDRAFESELRNLINVRHQNVVRLLGYCYESHHNYVPHNRERILCFEYMEVGSLQKHLQDESCDLDWQSCYKIIKGTCDSLNYLHSAKDHFSKPARESMRGNLIAAHDKNRARQPLHVLDVYGIGVAGRTSLVRHLLRDFYSPRMFQNIDSKTLLLGSIFDRVRQQSLNASLASDQSIERKIKDTIDFALGIDKQKNIREKRIDTDILWCIVNAFAEECNRAKLSVGPDIRPTTSVSLLCAEMCSRDMHTRIKPVQKPPSTKDVWTEGVDFSVTDSSLQKGDASGSPEVDTSFCSPPWVLDTWASVCWTCVYSILDFSTLAFLLRDWIENRRHRRGLRKSRRNNGRRMVSRKCLAQKTRYHKWGDIRAASQKNRGTISRSEPISADNSSLLTPDSTPERAWRVASAAPQHMTGYLNHLVDYTPSSGDQVIIDTPSMGRMPVHGRGSVNTTNMTLEDVLYVPGLEANLVSTGQLAELGYTIAIGPYGCRVYKDDEGMNLVGKAHYVDGYLLELDFLRVRASAN